MLRAEVKATMDDVIADRCGSTNETVFLCCSTDRAPRYQFMDEQYRTRMLQLAASLTGLRLARARWSVSMPANVKL